MMHDLVGSFKVKDVTLSNECAGHFVSFVISQILLDLVNTENEFIAQECVLMLRLEPITFPFKPRFERKKESCSREREILLLPSDQCECLGIN